MMNQISQPFFFLKLRYMWTVRKLDLIIYLLAGLIVIFNTAAYLLTIQGIYNIPGPGQGLIVETNRISIWGFAHLGKFYYLLEMPMAFLTDVGIPFALLFSGYVGLYGILMMIDRNDLLDFRRDVKVLLIIALLYGVLLTFMDMRNDLLVNLKYLGEI